ncbi:hypothetical protein N7517_007957 [Penicillium concentricum]|uniref:Clock-controlled protein 6 n=1 Tax=Penicillium concentricum TaxID=293559 RepID=A0A9W9RRJ4_9EURO|nr:uncharacterized protein N7517_007957 [Penicillium concentricum]KAJ5365071.1 hypothetical protein N7517_007957 [Penicillium concentricum]
MRFSIAALALAAGAMANVVTETVTQFTTYCPEATSIVHGGHTYSISTPGVITMTHGPFTVTRPIVTSTLFLHPCFLHSRGRQHPPYLRPRRCHLHPLVPGSASTGVPSGPSGPSSATPSQPAFNAGAINAATGAGAGLVAVFGAVALLL